MRSFKRILFIAMLFTSIGCYSQCDPATFEKFSNTEEPFNLLKRYSIPIRPVADESFTTQYSYIFTKGSTYGFMLKEKNGNDDQLSFRLTSNRMGVLNDEMFDLNDGKNTIMIYTAPATGVYYLNVLAQKSFQGCATLQLSFFRPPTQILSEYQQGFQKRFRKVRFEEDEKFLKDFLISGKDKSTYSYVLTKGTRYALYVACEKNNQLISLTIKNGSNEIVETEARTRGAGMFYVIDPEKTDMYSFEFKNPEKRYIGFARLLHLTGLKTE